MRIMTKMKKTAAAALALVMITAMTGCGMGSKAEPSKETQAQTEALAETLVDASIETSEKIEFTDAAGRSIILEKPAERIVSGYYITTSMLIALDLKDQVVGLEAKADKRPIYKLAAPEFLELPSVGTAKDFDVEGCAALKPDLVILPKKLTEQAEILAGLGINAMVVNPESTEELEETIVNIGKATGKSEGAEKLLAYYDSKSAQLEAIGKKAAEQGKKEPSIYISGTSEILRTAGSYMYQNTLITLAGGVNAAADLTDKGWTNISYEKLLSYDPDMIVIIPEAEYTKEDVLTDAQLKDLKAVKNKAVYEMPSSFEAWDSPITSGILGSMWLASIVNEEQYSFDQFGKDAAAFYEEFYGISIDTSMITK